MADPSLVLRSILHVTPPTEKSLGVQEHLAEKDGVWLIFSWASICSGHIIRENPIRKVNQLTRVMEIGRL